MSDSISCCENRFRQRRKNCVNEAPAEKLGEIFRFCLQHAKSTLDNKFSRHPLTNELLTETVTENYWMLYRCGIKWTKLRPRLLTLDSSCQTVTS